MGCCGIIQLAQDNDKWWACVNTKFGKLLDWQRNWQLLKKDCAAWNWLVGWEGGWLVGFFS